MTDGYQGELLTPYTDDLPQIPGGWTVRTCTFPDGAIDLTLPADGDAFLDDPEVHARHDVDGYMPYWAYLWPTACDLAGLILRLPGPRGLRALDLGCGLGLTGIAGLKAGWDVTFCDYDRRAVRIALMNAVRAGFPAPRGMWLDWNEPSAEQFDMILGCEVLYESRNHEPILGLLSRMLAPHGVAWLADPDRSVTKSFAEFLKARGFTHVCRELPRQPHPDRPVGTTYLWELRRGG